MRNALTARFAKSWDEFLLKFSEKNIVCFPSGIVRYSVTMVKWATKDEGKGTIRRSIRRVCLTVSAWQQKPPLLSQFCLGVTDVSAGNKNKARLTDYIIEKQKVKNTNHKKNKDKKNEQYHIGSSTLFIYGIKFSKVDGLKILVRFDQIIIIFMIIYWEQYFVLRIMLNFCSSKII